MWRNRFVTQEPDTIIIGAGPAGLAVGATLRLAGVPFVMLERAHRVGESWHGHYERLRLHTPKRHSALPHRPFPRDFPTYPSRDQVARYLEDYARAFDLRPDFGQAAKRCTRDESGMWNVSTDAGDYRGPHLVIATGWMREANIPQWPGLDTFPGPVIHSRDYVNGEPFRGQRTLVVGFGNSGAEIALDLHEHGAHCSVSVRGKVNVIPRDLLGIPIIVFALLWRPFPTRLADAANAPTLRLALGNLARLGLEKRDDGPFTQIAESRQIPVIDVGTIARIRTGDIAVRKGVQSVRGSEVTFADGTSERFDAIVLATGFTCGLSRLLPENRMVLDAHGCPRDHGREPAEAPGLYFCGYDPGKAGLLRQIGIEARRIARAITTPHFAGAAKRDGP
jgi:cation diffusion facilitator CzcD-associated flavoprotein CzcO